MKAILAAIAAAAIVFHHLVMVAKLQVLKEQQNKLVHEVNELLAHA